MAEAIFFSPCAKRKVFTVMSRPETGPMQFGDDWPGVFIRGDNAAAWAMAIGRVLNQGQLDHITLTELRSLMELLIGSNVNFPDRPEPQTLKEFEKCRE